MFLGSDICILEKLIRDKDKQENQSSTTVSSEHADKVNKSINKLPSSTPKIAGFGKSQSLKFGKSIPPGLSLNKNASKSVQLPSPQQSHTNVNNGSESRSRSGSLDDSSKDESDFAVMSVLQLRALRSSILTTITHLQEQCICWLFDILQNIELPNSMNCSLLSSGKLQSTISSNVMDSIPQDGSVSKFCFSTGIQGSDQSSTIDINDDHLRLWLEWIKICISLNNQLNTIRVRITFSVSSTYIKF
jgi:hypothetical protein